MKRGTIHVDFFTDYSYVYEHASISQANKFYPDWWKKLPKQYDEISHNFSVPRPTMKTCRGFIDLYANSIIIPSWTEMMISVQEKDYQITTPTDDIKNVAHSYVQREGFLKNFHHAKIITPWIAKSKKDTLFTWQRPMYNFENPLDFVFFDGALEFKYQNALNINLAFRKIQKTIKIDFLQPLVMLTPQTEKKLVFKTHLISKQEYHSLVEKSKSTTFINSYLKLRRNKEQEEKKCPFHF